MRMTVGYTLDGFVKTIGVREIENDGDNYGNYKNEKLLSSSFVHVIFASVWNFFLLSSTAHWPCMGTFL